MQNKTKKIVIGALISAIYAIITYLVSVFGLAFGPIQFRVSEALTVLPVFTSAAIPGLTIGCLLANLGSSMVLDTLIGSFATLIAAILSYLTRKITFKGLPLLSLSFPALINGIFIGGEISLFFLEEKAFLTGFLISFLEVAASELVVCYGLGIPLFLLLNRHKKTLFK